MCAWIKDIPALLPDEVDEKAHEIRIALGVAVMEATAIIVRLHRSLTCWKKKSVFPVIFLLFIFPSCLN